MKRVLIVFSVRLFSANANFVRMKLSFYKKKNSSEVCLNISNAILILSEVNGTSLLLFSYKM